MRPNKNDKSGSARWMGFREPREPEAQGCNFRKQRNWGKQNPRVKRGTMRLIHRSGMAQGNFSRCLLLVYHGSRNQTLGLGSVEEDSRTDREQKHPSQKLSYFFNSKKQTSKHNWSHHSNSWATAKVIQSQWVKEWHLKLRETKYKLFLGFPGLCPALYRW